MDSDQHSRFNDKCPINQEYEDAAGLPCSCAEDGFRNPNEVGDLRGQDLLDALTEAWNNDHYKGWTYGEMIRGASVLPTSVYDEKSEDQRIVKYECIVSAQYDHGETVGLTLMVTTPDGTVYKDFVPAG